MDISVALIHAVTEYDRRESTKPGYNIYALPQYLGAVPKVAAAYNDGAALPEAVCVGYSGKLANYLIREVGKALHAARPDRTCWSCGNPTRSLDRCETCAEPHTH